MLLGITQNIGWLKYILMPLIGAFIGYFTNDIAIKMLFRPRKAVYIGKWRLPFTPGIIPKEKKRIAKSLGAAVAGQLFDRDTILRVITSDETTGKLKAALKGLIERNTENEKTIAEVLKKYLGEETYEVACGRVKTAIADAIYKRLSEADIGSFLSDKLMDILRGQLEKSRLGILANILEKSSISATIGTAINNYVAEHGETLLKETVSGEIDKLTEKELREIFLRIEKSEASVLDFIVGLYKSVVENNIDKIINAMNISKIVEEKINGFSEEELEKLIFSVMKKELRAIVYLGALLGFFVGFVNLIL